MTTEEGKTGALQQAFVLLLKFKTMGFLAFCNTRNCSNQEIKDHCNAYTPEGRVKAT